MPTTFAERFVFGTPDPAAQTVQTVPRSTTALIGRLALAAIFLVSGFAKLADPQHTVAYMTGVGIPMAGVLVYVAAAFEIVGALSLALGAFARVGAILLIAFLIPTTLAFHAFWRVPDAERQQQIINFLKNLAILGGLVMVVAKGPGRASVDARLRKTLVALVIAVLAIAGCRTIPAAPPADQQPTLTANPTPVMKYDPGQVARGAYVSDLAGCKTCHTPMTAGVVDRAHPFAGGLEVTMPGNGVWRSPNISSDRDTGIGAWSDTQVIAAIRRGTRPDGGKLLPIMPYPFYHRITDADAKAVVVYLRTQRPFYSRVERSSGLAMAPVDLPEPTDNTDNVEDPKAHGEYLANLMHCAACHTPREGAQANVAFAGGVKLPLSATETITSSNITSDPETGIGQWSEIDIIAAVRTGKTPSGHQIVGPMAMYLDGWSKLDDRDAHALAIYIKSIAPANNEIPTWQATR